MKLNEIDKEFFLKTQLPGDKPAKIRPNDIAIGCPLCNEGKSFGRKQRCHLYIKPGLDQPLVHCYNCGWHSNLPNYLKTIDESLYKDYKKKTKLNTFERLKRGAKLNKIETEKLNNNEINLNLLNPPNNFLKNVTPLFEYLKKRNLLEFSNLFYYSDTDTLINDKFIPTKESIIIPLQYGEYLYGFQARKIKEKRFYTYLPESNSGFKVWNYFNVNKEKPVFIFESVFDALSSGLPLNNIIAGLGAEIPKTIIDSLKYPIFALDNPFKDKTAREKYLKLVENYHCVIWGKDLNVKDFNELLQFWDRERIKNYIIQNVKKGLKAKLMLELL